MNKIIRFMQNYLIIGLPFVIVFLMLSAIHPDNKIITYAINHYRTFWNTYFIGLMLWLVALFLFLVCLILAPAVRERTLKRLANLNERDEREEYITGKASRSSYIFTLTVMIFFLFLSMFSVNLYKIPEERYKIENSRYRLGVQFHFDVTNKTESNKTNEDILIFDSKNLLPSTSAIIFILLGCQLLAFNITARRENIKNA